MKKWLAAGVVGLVAVPLWWVLSDAAFEGNARSLIWVNILVAGLVIVALWAILRPTGRNGWTRFGKHFGIAAVTCLLVAGVAWVVMASQEGHCGPSTRLHAEWHEPGIYNATANGVPGAKLGESGGPWRIFYVDGEPIVITIYRDDGIDASSPNVDWSQWSDDINRTLGQVQPLTYAGLQTHPLTTVC